MGSLFVRGARPLNEVALVCMIRNLTIGLRLFVLSSSFSGSVDGDGDGEVIVSEEEGDTFEEEVEVEDQGKSMHRLLTNLVLRDSFC